MNAYEGSLCLKCQLFNIENFFFLTLVVRIRGAASVTYDIGVHGCLQVKSHSLASLSGNTRCKDLFHSFWPLIFNVW